MHFEQAFERLLYHGKFSVVVHICSWVSRLARVDQNKL
jgi:hypothetical protein